MVVRLRPAAVGVLLLKLIDAAGINELLLDSFQPPRSAYKRRNA